MLAEKENRDPGINLLATLHPLSAESGTPPFTNLSPPPPIPPPTAYRDRAVLLTLGDLVQDWRGGKLLRPRSDASSNGTQPQGAGGSRGGGGVAAAAAAAAGAAAPGQELDPTGVARALRLLFERVKRK